MLDKHWGLGSRLWGAEQQQTLTPSQGWREIWGVGARGWREMGCEHPQPREPQLAPRAAREGIWLRATIPVSTSATGEPRGISAERGQREGGGKKQLLQRDRDQVLPPGRTAGTRLTMAAGVFSREK